MFNQEGQVVGTQINITQPKGCVHIIDENGIKVVMPDPSNVDMDKVREILDKILEGTS